MCIFRFSKILKIYCRFFTNKVSDYSGSIYLLPLNTGSPNSSPLPISKVISILIRISVRTLCKKKSNISILSLEKTAKDGPAQ